MENVLVIGIAGGTASGKTTVVKKIMERFHEQIALLELDCYYVDMGHLSYEERIKMNFDHPKTLDFQLMVEHLKQLKKGKAIDKPLYDFSAYTRMKETSKVMPAKIIIVEGILIFAVAELRELFDIKVFVDTEADIRIMRRIKRDIKERGRTLESVEKQYFETVRPMYIQFIEPSKQFADIIIPRGGSNKVAINMLTTKIKSMLEE